MPYQDTISEPTKQSLLDKRFLRGRDFFLNGIQNQNEHKDVWSLLNQIVFDLSYFFYRGDEELKVEPMRSSKSRRRAKEIMKTFGRSNFDPGDVSWAELERYVEKKCGYEKKRKPRVYQETSQDVQAKNAARRVQKAYVKFLEVKGYAPDINELMRFGKCRRSTAQQVIEKLLSGSASPVSLKPKPVERYQQTVKSPVSLKPNQNQEYIPDPHMHSAILS